MNSPDQIEDGFEQPHSRPRVTLGDLRSEDEPGHHSPSHPLPQKGATYPPGPLDEPAQSSRRRTWNGRPADQTDSTDALVQSPTFEARLRRVQRRITNLATPETPVGKPPNFWKQMRNIFGKCTPLESYLFFASGVLIPTARDQRAFARHSGFCGCFGSRV